MTAIDRCCEGFGPARRRQQKTRAAGSRRAQLRFNHFANYTCSVPTSSGLFVPGREFREPRRGRRMLGQFQSFISAPCERAGCGKARS